MVWSILYKYVNLTGTRVSTQLSNCQLNIFQRPKKISRMDRLRTYNSFITQQGMMLHQTGIQTILTHCLVFNHSHNNNSNYRNCRNCARPFLHTCISNIKTDNNVLCMNSLFWYCWPGRYQIPLLFANWLFHLRPWIIDSAWPIIMTCNHTLDYKSGSSTV